MMAESNEKVNDLWQECSRVAEEIWPRQENKRGVRYRLRASDTRHGHGTPEKNARGISRRAPRLQRGSCLSTSQRLHYDSSLIRGQPREFTSFVLLVSENQATA